MEENSDYSELLKLRLGRSFDLADSYLGTKYDICATSSVCESISLGQNVEERKAVLVSFGVSPEYVERELESLPQVALSGFRTISRDRSTTVVRAFVMETIPFELILRIRCFDFERSEHKQFWSRCSAGVILIDQNNFTIYSNKAGSAFCDYFKVINPVEPKESDI